jgi:hypothetical protein
MFSEVTFYTLLHIFVDFEFKSSENKLVSSGLKLQSFVFSETST